MTTILILKTVGIHSVFKCRKFGFPKPYLYLKSFGEASNK